MIRYLDMFAGIGGFRSALERVGSFKCVAYCEIDKYAKKAYEAMYDTEGELYFHDARKIIPEELPDIDLICGGFPCQSFSQAGKRRGFDDIRGTLFFEIVRIATVKKPKYLLLENVPGLLSHDSGRTFATILSSLDELGYDVAWQVLNSADHQVPQSRKRVFIIGFLRGKCAGRVLSFTDANPKTLVQRVPGSEGNRIYSIFGLSVTLTSQAGGFGGKTGLYEIMGIPIKSKTKSGYQVAFPGDSVDLSYATMNTRRGRVGTDIAHTLTTSSTQGYYFVYCIDMNDQPLVEFARQVAITENLIDMNEMAKLARAENIPIGRNRLFGWLRSRGILMGNNLPYQRFIDRGYFAVKESVFETGSMSKTYQQTFVTGKGQRFVIGLLKKYYGKGENECQTM